MYNSSTHDFETLIFLFSRFLIFLACDTVVPRPPGHTSPLLWLDILFHHVLLKAVASRASAHSLHSAALKFVLRQSNSGPFSKVCHNNTQKSSLHRGPLSYLSSCLLPFLQQYTPPLAISSPFHDALVGLPITFHPFQPKWLVQGRVNI